MDIQATMMQGNIPEHIAHDIVHQSQILTKRDDIVYHYKRLIGIMKAIKKGGYAQCCVNKIWDIYDCVVELWENREDLKYCKSFVCEDNVLVCHVGGNHGYFLGSYVPQILSRDVQDYVDSMHAEGNFGDFTRKVLRHYREIIGMIDEIYWVIKSL